MSVQNIKGIWYCEECGMEMTHKGKLCEYCSKSQKGLRKMPKKKTGGNTKGNVRRSGKHFRDVSER